MRAPVRYCVAIFSVAVTLMSVGITSASANAGGSVVFSPGAPGVGDPYFQGYGNGGYDVEHYDLAITAAGRSPSPRATTGSRRPSRATSSWAVSCAPTTV
jgi:hypothetical protein